MIYALILAWQINGRTAYTAVPYDTHRQCLTAKKALGDQTKNAVCLGYAATEDRMLRRHLRKES